jgi:hypothetical protein
MAVELLDQNGDTATEAVKLPSPTAWPIVLAFGISLVFGGMVTSGAVSVLGAIVAIAGAVGWFRDVLPHEAHEVVHVVRQVPVVRTTRHEVDRIEIEPGLRRAWLPVEIYPISAGVKGGLAGSVAMALLAMLYGLLRGTSIWYPINLLAAGFFPQAVTMTTAQIAAFHLRAFLIAVPIHLTISLLVGLLYGATLPMLPRRPILWGGVVAPILWTGLIHSVLSVVNPVLNQRIDWRWFVLTQMGYGIVAGLAVSRQECIPSTGLRLPLALRTGVEASGVREENLGENERR